MSYGQSAWLSIKYGIIESAAIWGVSAVISCLPMAHYATLFLFNPDHWKIKTTLITFGDSGLRFPFVTINYLKNIFKGFLELLKKL